MKILKYETCKNVYYKSCIVVEMQSWSTQGLTNKFYICTQLHAAERTEWSKSDRGESKRNDTNELTYKTERDS